MLKFLQSQARAQTGTAQNLVSPAWSPASIFQALHEDQQSIHNTLGMVLPNPDWARHPYFGLRKKTDRAWLLSPAGLSGSNFVSLLLTPANCKGGAVVDRRGHTCDFSCKNWESKTCYAICYMFSRSVSPGPGSNEGKLETFLSGKEGDENARKHTEMGTESTLKRFHYEHRR